MVHKLLYFKVSISTLLSPDVCGDAHSFCGLKDKLYPDKRTMGYPFDRSYQAQSLEEFVSEFTNMKISPLTIKFNNVIIERDQ